MAGKISALSVIDKEIKENGYTRRIGRLPYPFLNTLPKFSASKWKDEIHQVNILAHDTFATGDSLRGINDLVKWQKTSPSSWLICKINAEICGFVHVEPLSGKRGGAIRNGASHEGEIEPRDILKPNKLKACDYIHIGSIVSKPTLNKTVRSKVVVRLLSGIVDRILELSSPNSEGVHRVLAVDYPDANGKYHARRLFRTFGFEHQSDWLTSENPPDDVYILDINKASTPALRKLMDAVIKRREKYRERWKKIFLIIAVSLTICSIVLLFSVGWLPASVVAVLALLNVLLSLLKHFREELKRLLHS